MKCSENTGHNIYSGTKITRSIQNYHHTYYPTWTVNYLSDFVVDDYDCVDAGGEALALRLLQP